MLIAEEAQRGQKIMISYSESEGLGIRPV